MSIIKARDIIRADLDSGYDARTDIELQIGLITLLEFHMATLGRKSIGKSEIMADWGTLMASGIPAIGESDLARKIDSVCQTISEISILEGMDSDLIGLSSFKLNWDEMPQSFMDMRRSIEESLERKYNGVIPHLLHDKIAALERRNFECTESVSRLLVTCGVFKDEGILRYRGIKESLESLIENARTRLYMMISYYKVDVDYFRAFLVKHLRESEIEFRLLYRPEDADNRRLVLELKENLEPLGYRDFYRAYDSRYLNDEYSPPKQFIGYLHSKMIISENEIILGSANLTHLSLNRNLETAIHSRDKEIVEEATSLFNLIWRVFDEPRVIA